MINYKICKRNYILNKYEMYKPEHILDPIIFKVGEKYYFEFIKSSYPFVKSIYKFKIKDGYNFSLVETEIDKFFCTPTEIRKQKIKKINETLR